MYEIKSKKYFNSAMQHIALVYLIKRTKGY